MNYFANSLDSNSRLNKAIICNRMEIAASSLYYQPKLPAKDLELKRQIEAIILEHKLMVIAELPFILGLIKNEFIG